MAGESPAHPLRYNQGETPSSVPKIPACFENDYQPVKMVDMDFVLETFATVVFTIYYIFEGIIKALLPASYLPNKDISRDTALVTGAGSGIGRALAISLAKQGCRLVLWDINEEGNQETASKIREFGGHAHPYTVDLSKREQIYSVADQVLSEVGEIAILVNNAGVATGRNFLNCSDDHIERTIEVNAKAHLWTVKAFLPAMLDRDHGHIVNVASSAGLLGINGLTDYCTSKFAAVGFLESLALELKSMHKSIHTTIVCPWLVETPLLNGMNILLKYPNAIPLLKVDYVVSKIMDAILTNQEVLYIPKLLYPGLALKALLPTKALYVLLKYLGATTAMNDGGMGPGGLGEH